MVTSGNWLTPQIHLPSGLEPYQGKPPLHFWITAAFLKFAGNSEVTARLPSLLGMLVCLSALWCFAARFFSRQIAALASVLFASSALSLLLSGSVHLDFTLSASVAWMIVGFCLYGYATESTAKFTGLVPFIAAALGLLTKGPIAIVLASIVILPMLLLRRELRKLSALPWLPGVALFLLISAPWFYLQEQASPGFIRYFFINENLLRYVTKSYGDRYGEGHVAPYGSAIPMLLYGTLPWSLSLLLVFSKRLRPSAHWPLFAVWWGFAPALFFSLSRQLLEAYMLPAYVGLAIFCAWLIDQAGSCENINARVSMLVKSCGKIFLMITFLVLFGLGLVALSPLLGSSSHFAPWMTPPNRDLLLGCLVFGFGLLTYWRLSNSSLSATAARSCLAFTTLFCTLLVVAGQFASDKKSTGPILQAIRSEHDSSTPLVVGIAFGKPFSAYFYDDAVASSPITIVRVDPHVAPDSAGGLPANLIVLKKDLSALTPELMTRYLIAKDFTFWLWLKLR